MFVQVFKSRVRPDNVERLLAVRGPAIEEAQAACPELLAAQLVRVDEETWLDILTWKAADSGDRLMARAAELPLLQEMHGLVEEVVAVDGGEVASAVPAA